MAQSANRNAFGSDLEHDDPGTPEEQDLYHNLEEARHERREEWEDEEHSAEADRLVEQYGDRDECRYDLADLYARTSPVMEAIHAAVTKYEWDEADWLECLDMDEFLRVQRRKYQEMLSTPDLIHETIECAGVERTRKVLQKSDNTFGEVPS